MTRPVNFTDYSSSKLVATAISGFWSQYNNSRVKALDNWKEVDLYRFATDTRDLKGGNNFDHSMHTPAVHMIDEKLGSILNATAFPHEDWLGWEPLDRTGISKDKRDKVLAYLKKIHSLTGFTRIGKKSLDDLRAYGNAFLQTAMVDESKVVDGQVVAGYIGPKTHRISPYDIIFDPTAPSFDDSFKIVRQRMTVGEFARFAKNFPESVDQEVVKGILLRRTGTGDSVTSNDYFKDAQFTAQGFDSLTSYFRSGYVDLLFFYGSIFDEASLEVIDDRCIIIADYGDVVSNYSCPESRIRKGGWKERGDNLWSQGPLEPIIGLNYMINHRQNAKNDAIDRMINPDELYIGEPEIIYDDSTGRREIWAPVGGDARDIAPDSSTLSFNTEIELIQQDIVQSVGLPSDVLGFRSPGEKTAFEVQNLTEGAFRGFIDKVAQYEQDCIEKVIKDQIAIAIQNFQAVATVLSADNDGIRTVMTVTKEDLEANAQIQPRGSRRFTRMLQQLAGIQSMSQLHPIIAGHVNSYNLAKAISELSGLEEYGIISKFAAIDEQGEAEKRSMLVQQDLVQSMEQETPTEMGME